MSRIRCGIKKAKLGATVFGRRKPIAKDWWVGLWPPEDKDTEPTQLSKQETPDVGKEGDLARGEDLALVKGDQLTGSEQLAQSNNQETPTVLDDQLVEAVDQEGSHAS